MKSCFLTIGAIFMVALCVFKPCMAQELPQACDGFCICVSDTSCSSVTGCDALGEGCAETRFSINAVSGCVLKLDVLLSCGDCEHCFACGVVVDMDGDWRGGAQAGCVTETGCTGVTTLNLPAGNYKLLACLRMCANSTCAQCAGCIAKVRLYDTIEDCTIPCNW